MIRTVGTIDLGGGTHIVKGSGLKSALRFEDACLARQQNFLLIEAGDAFEAGEQTPEGAAEEE